MKNQKLKDRELLRQYGLLRQMEKLVDNIENALNELIAKKNAYRKKQLNSLN